MKRYNTITSSAFNLRIKNNKGFVKPVYIDKSVLISYDIICTEINKVFQNKNNIEKIDLKPIYIYLKHEHLENITIYNNDEWNFLYNYNIIQECVSNNRLKLDFAVIKENEMIDEEKRQRNSFNILQYIMKKIPEYFYLEILSKFIYINKDIREKFQKFFLNELMNISYDEIKNKNNDKNDLNSLINNYNNIYNQNNKNYYVKSKDFLKLFNEQILKIKNHINYIHLINNIIEDKNIENKNNNINEINKDDNLYNAEKVFIDKDNILFRVLNKEIEHKKYLDKNNYFKKSNNKEYYCGIEELKDGMKREIINILNDINTK